MIKGKEEEGNMYKVSDGGNEERLSDGMKGK